MSFSNHYAFGMTNTVVIKSENGKYLRVNPNSLGKADGSGGTGLFAQWEAQPMDGGSKLKLRSKKTGKYLRIWNRNVDVQGAGGPYTVFIVHRSGNKVKLESQSSKGQYVAVGPFGDMSVGLGVAFCTLEVYRQSGGQQQQQQQQHHQPQIHQIQQQLQNLQLGSGYNPQQRMKIVLRSNHGNYLKVPSKGPAGYSDVITADSVFVSVPVKPGVVGIKLTTSDQYLQRSGNPKLTLAPHCQAWEQWQVESSSNGTFGFRSCHQNQYLKADPGQGPSTSALQLGPWEQWTVLVVGAQQQQPQQPSGAGYNPSFRSRVRVKNCHGQFLSLSPHGSFQWVPSANQEATFVSIPVPNQPGVVVLKLINSDRYIAHSHGPSLSLGSHMQQASSQWKMQRKDDQKQGEESQYSMLSCMSHKYLCADPGKSPVVDRDNVGPWETFQFLTVQQGYHPERQCSVALLNEHGKYISMNKFGQCSWADSVSTDTTFISVPVPNQPGIVGFKLASSDQYLQRGNQPFLTLAPNLLSLEQWQVQSVGKGKWSIKACNANKFMCADPGRIGPIIDRDNAGGWESWDIQVVGRAPTGPFDSNRRCNFAIRCHTGKYLRMMPDGQHSYTPSIGPNAKFVSIPVSGKSGVVGIKRFGSDHYLGRGFRLVQWLQSDEEWYPEKKGTKFALRHCGSAKYACADPGKSSFELSRDNGNGPWEQFELVML